MRVLLCCLLLCVAGCGYFVGVDDYLKRASVAKAAGDYGLAAIELRNALQSDPKNLQVRINLVDVLLLQSDLAAVDREVAELRQQGLGSSALQAAAADVIARVMLAKRDFQSLLTAIQAGELPLADSTLQLREAQALMGLGQAALARDKLQAFLVQVPHSDEGQLSFVQLLSGPSESARAIREIDAVLARSPTYAHAWFAKGMWQTLHAGPSDAAESFAKAAEHAAGQLTRAEETIVVSLLADRELALGRIDAATKWQQRLVVIAPGAPVTQLTTARVAVANEDYATAIGILQKLVSANPNLVMAQVALGRALAAQGNLRQAEAELNKVVTKESANVDARMALVEVNLQLGQSVRAIELLAPVAFMMRNSQISALMGRAQAAVANSPSDLASLLNGQKRDPDNAGLRMLTAGALLYARQPSQAYALLRDAGTGRFNIDRIPVLLAAITADKGIAVARVEAEKLAAANADVEYLVTLGMFFAGARDYPTARTWFERALTKVRGMQAADAKATEDEVHVNTDVTVDDKLAVARRTGELGLLKLLGTVDARLGNKPAALAGIQAYRQAHPDDDAATLIEGDIQIELQNFSTAVTIYESVFAQSPSQQTAIALYRARRLAGTPAASQSLDQWLKSHDGDIAVRMLLAEYYQASGDASRAMGEYERIITSQPVNVPALNNLAILYQSKGDKRAEATARQAFNRADKSPEIADTYGWILLQNGKVDEATKILTTALAGAPKHPDIQFHYAMALAKTGKVAAARKQLTDLLAQYPQFATRAEAVKALNDLQ